MTADRGEAEPAERGSVGGGRPQARLHAGDPRSPRPSAPGGSGGARMAGEGRAVTINLRDVAAGILFVAIGGWFVVSALELELGTALRMGPGYFPLVLAGLLILLGALVVIRGIRDRPAHIGSVAWRGGSSGGGTNPHATK